MDDSKIIELFWQRSELAIDALAKKYEKLCWRIAWNILRNREDVQECVNDAYLGCWNTIPPQKPNPLSTYLCRVVRNQAIARYHANTAQKRNSYYDVALEELENCLAGSDTPDSLLSAKELPSLLDRFLDSLDEKSRVLFVGRYWYSDSVKDLAKKFHTTPNQISVRLFRIREKLRKYLKKEGYLL